jgi:hypothetical protein
MNLNNIKYEVIKEYDIPVEKRIENWEVGIGLNEVDGLKPSRYLIELTKDSIINNQRKKLLLSTMFHLFGLQKRK